MQDNTHNLEPAIPTPQEVEGVFLELNEYNNQHTGLGPLMGHLLLDHLKREGVSNPSDDLPNDRFGEADITKSILEMTSEHTLSSIGLGLYDAGNVLDVTDNDQ